MPNDKIFETQLLYEAEISNVKESAEKWKDFLDFSAQLQISKIRMNMSFLQNCLFTQKIQMLQTVVHLMNGNQTTEITLNLMKQDYQFFLVTVEEIKV